MLNSLIFLTAFSSIYLNRFGLQITQDFSLSFSYIFLYASLATAYAQFKLVVDFASFICFLALSFSGYISYAFGGSQRSLTSFFLFCFIYFPLVLRPAKQSNNSTFLFANLYLSLLVPLAFLGIAQFFLQFIISPAWLFDFRPFLPELIKNKNIMNSVIPIGPFIKSNGFFCLEPSIFSQWMSLGILLFLLFPCNYIYIFFFYLGLALSFSGTGVIMLLFTVIFSFFWNKWRIVQLNTVPILLFVLFAFFGAGNLTLQRIQEFSGGQQLKTTSAAARFVNPFIATRDNLFSSEKAFFFGKGPGSTLRSKDDFDYHDPAYAKLLIEYGMVGGLLFFFLLRSSFRDFFKPLTLIAVFLIQFLFLGGHLLTFDVVVVYIIFFKLAPLLEPL